MMWSQATSMFYIDLMLFLEGIRELKIGGFTREMKCIKSVSVENLALESIRLSLKTAIFK